MKTTSKRARRPGEAGGIHATDLKPPRPAERLDVDMRQRNIFIDQPDFNGTT